MDDIALAEARAAERAPQEASAEALFNLGLKCSLGIDGPADVVAAQSWLNLAAMKGSIPARICRRDLASGMTPSQMAEAHRLTAQWLAPHP